MRISLLMFALVAAQALVPCMVSAGDIKTDGKFVSTETINPPIAVSSSALVPNLNVDRLDGYHANEFVRMSYTATSFSAIQQIYFSGSDGKLPDNVVDDGSIDDVVRRIFLGCNQINPGFSSNPPAMDLFGATPALVFGQDAVPTEKIYVSILIPDDWNGTSSIEIRLLSATLLQEGDVYWFIGGGAHADDENVTATPVLLGGFSVSYASDTLRGLVRSTPATIDAGDLERRDLLSFELERDSGMPQDTLQGDAYLLGIEITYTASR